MEVALDRDAIGDAVLYARQRGLDKRHAAGIIGGSNAVFGYDQITVEILRHLADDIFQCLRIKLVVHLGQLGTLRGGQLPLRTVQRAGVVLHAEEIILFNIRKIVGELFLPCGGGKAFAARLGLQIVQGERQPHLDLGADRFDGLPRGGVGAQNQQITLRRALADENFRLWCTEHGGVFGGNILHVLHHLLEVHTHLHAALCGFARVGGGLGGLLCHQAEPLGDGRQLQAHICFVDGADVRKLAAQLPHHIADIALEVFDSGFRFPAALGDQPLGAGEVQQRHNRLDPVCLAAGNDLAVMLDLGGVELTLLRLDARPFDGKAVGVQPGAGQQLDVLLILIIMVAGDAARLGKAGVGQLLLCPVVGMDVVALDLMGGSGRAHEESFFKFLHDFLLIYACLKQIKKLLYLYHSIASAGCKCIF